MHALFAHNERARIKRAIKVGGSSELTRGRGRAERARGQGPPEGMTAADPVGRPAGPNKTCNDPVDAAAAAAVSPAKVALSSTALRTRPARPRRRD